MQINIIKIIEKILLNGKFVEGCGFVPKHQIIYDAFAESNQNFEKFLKSCLLDKAPDVSANQQTMMQYIKVELSQYKAKDYLSEESKKDLEAKLKTYNDAKQDLYALCQNTLTTELSNHIMFQEFDYINNGRKLEWDQNTLSFKGQLRANKIMELSDVKQDN